MFLFLLQLIILYQSASIPACIIHYVEVLMKCAIVVVSCCYLCVDAEHKCDTSPYPPLSTRGGERALSANLG